MNKVLGTYFVPEVGDRIRLLDMPDDPCPIEPGAEGVVEDVHDISFANAGETQYQLTVKWDNGRTLHPIIPPDRVVKVEEPATLA